MNSDDLLFALFNCGSFSLGGEDLPKGPAWEDLIQTARRELLLPALRSRLEVLGLSAQLPPEIMDVFSAVEELNAERNRAILASLSAVASLLNDSGIEPVLLKGAAYCLTGVYENPALRYLWDVDLLIPEGQLPAAVAALSENGFTSDPNDRLGHFRHHHPPLSRAGEIAFELHDSLGMGACKSLLPAVEVLEQSVVFDFLGARVRLPSPTHMVAHLIMHSQIQHPYNERIWPPLRAMFDLALLQRRFASEIDWCAITHRFKNAGQSGVLALHMLHVRDVLGLPIPFPLHLTPLTQLRRLRRRLLGAAPALRFIDPFYMYSITLMRRFRLLGSVLRARGGWKHLATELATLAIYRRLIMDFVEGRGR